MNHTSVILHNNTILAFLTFHVPRNPQQQRCLQKKKKVWSEHFRIAYWSINIGLKAQLDTEKDALHSISTRHVR